MYCTKCGNALGLEDIFCNKCGNKRVAEVVKEKIKETKDAINIIEQDATTIETISTTSAEAKGIVMTSAIPLEDESIKYRKVYLIAGVIGFFITGLNPFGAILVGWFVGFIVRNFGLCAKLVKICKQEYQLKPGTTKKSILHNSTTQLMQRGFKVSDTQNYLVITSNEYKNIEYKIFVNEDTNTFRIDTFYNIKGRLLNKRLYYKLYKSAVANNGIIAYTIQNSN